MKPLQGITVLDFTHAYAGPYCTYLLALAGAKVIKVESPGGDEHRTRSLFDQLNAGKRSIVLDLKSSDGQDVARRLALHADVVVENFRPGVAETLKVDAKRLREVSETLIYCSITGFGLDGASSSRPALEWTAQAATGITSLYLGQDDDPMFNGLSLLDPFSGFFAYSAILSAVLERQRTGRGRVLDVSLAEAGMLLQAARVFESLQGSATAPGPGTRLRRPTMARFPTASGQEVFIAALHDKWFVGLCQEIGAPEIASDKRFATAQLRQDAGAKLYEKIAERTSLLTMSVLLERLASRGIPAEPINDFMTTAADLVREQHWTVPIRVRSGEVIEAFRPSLGEAPGISSCGHADSSDADVNTQPHEVASAPHLGEHTESILAENGYSRSAIEALLACGAVRSTLGAGAGREGAM